MGTPPCLRRRAGSISTWLPAILKGQHGGPQPCDLRAGRLGDADRRGGREVKRYLRAGTTWSAIAETYRDGSGRVIVLGRILWIKGNGSAHGDVHPLFFVVEREFSLRELEFFPQAGVGFDVRKLKVTLSDVFLPTNSAGIRASSHACSASRATARCASCTKRSLPRSWVT